MAIPVISILFTVFQSICQVFFICLAGYTLSSSGIVDKPTSKVLNHINIALFTPALLFSKVAFFLTPAKLRQLWVIPIFFTVLTCLSGLIAHYLARACRLKRSQVNFATAASMFMNSNSLPVALMQSLAATVPILKWGPDDTLNAMFGRSLTYLVVFSTLGMILRWSYGVQLLTSAEDDDNEPPTIYTDADHPEPPLSHIAVVTPTARLIDYDTDDGRPAPILPHQPTVLSHPRVHIRARTLRTRLSAATARRPSHSHLPAVPTALGDESESESESDDAGAQTTEEDSEGTLAIPSSSQTSLPSDRTLKSPRQTRPSPVQQSSKQTPPEPKSWRQRLLAPLSLLSPPLAASLVALIVVIIPPLQKALNSDMFIPFRGALDAAGGCSVTLTLIVLGGWFWEGDKGSSPKGVTNGLVNENENDRSETKKEGKGKAVEKPTIVHDHVRNHVDVDAQEDSPSQSASHTDNEGDLGQAHGGLHPQLHTRARRLASSASPSRTPSTISLSSVFSMFGDVVMARIHGGSGRRKTRERPSLGSLRRGEVDAEAGEGLTTHVETMNETERLLPRDRSQSRSGSRIGTMTPTPTKYASRATPNTGKTVGKSSSPSPSLSSNPPGESLTIAVTLIARMIIVPLVVTPMMIAIRQTGWGGDVFDDPVFLVSSMLLIASPPALTLAQISQRAQKSGSGGTDPNAFSPFERLLSRTVFWAYCVLTPPLTILSVMVGLMIVGAYGA